MRNFAFIFSQVHLDFRVAEFASICSLFGIAFDQSTLSVQRHVQVLQFEDRSVVRQILSRSVLVKTAVELLANAPDFDALVKELYEKRHLLQRFNAVDQSFSIRVRSVGRKTSQSKSASLIDRLGEVLPLANAPVDLVNPVNEFCFIEEFRTHSRDSPPDEVFFGVLVGHGQSRLKSDYCITERCYIGNTTMDPELSFIQANLVQANVGSVVLDPFCGSGGLLIAAAHFGATVIGTEINSKIARAVGKSSRVGAKPLTDRESLQANFAQYGLDEHFGGLIIADASWHDLWRAGPSSSSDIFDAIVTDPPYGVREKSRKVGKKARKAHWTLPGSEHEVHYPEKTKYAMSNVFLDLLNLAAKTLVVGGKLAFWFPVFGDEYSEAVLPKHGALSLVANCEQPLSLKYSRRLLVYEKRRAPHEGEKAFVERDCYETTTFRERIFVNNS